MPNTATAQAILDAVNGELGLPLVQFGAASSDQTGRQAQALLDSVCNDLSRVHDWHFLEAEQSYTGDGSTTEFPLPDAFGRIVNQTIWELNSNRPVLGPAGPQLWGWIKYGLISPSGYYQYRIKGENLVVTPAPESGVEFTLTYISKNWATTAAGAPRSSVNAGGNIILFEKRLVIAALKARLWGQKGFDTTQVQAEFNYVLEAEKGQTQGAPVLSLTSRRVPYLITDANVPEGSWNQ